jgi:hypothetical protein
MVPPLIKGYLRVGAWVCGEPAWDPDFNTADLLLLLPMSRMNPRYMRHFVKPNGSGHCMRAPGGACDSCRSDGHGHRCMCLMLSDVYFPRINGVSTSIQTFRAELERLGLCITVVAPDYPGSSASATDTRPTPFACLPGPCRWTPKTG